MKNRGFTPRGGYGRLAGSTLSELLVVMVISSVLLLTLFEGFSLFQRFMRGMEKDLSTSIQKFNGYQHLEHLFLSSDSLKESHPGMEFFRDGEVKAKLHITDSLLIVELPGGRIDTLFSKLSSPHLVSNRDNPWLVDSLRFMNDTTELYFGISYNPGWLTGQKLKKTAEETYDED